MVRNHSINLVGKCLVFNRHTPDVLRIPSKGYCIILLQSKHYKMEYTNREPCFHSDLIIKNDAICWCTPSNNDPTTMPVSQKLKISDHFIFELLKNRDFSPNVLYARCYSRSNKQRWNVSCIPRSSKSFQRDIPTYLLYTPATWKDVEKLNAFLDDNKSFSWESMK